MHKEILGELNRSKEKLNEIRASVSKDGRKSKSKFVYIGGCDVMRHYFGLEYIPTSGTDPISVVSPSMLKWHAMSQYKTLREATGIL